MPSFATDVKNALARLSYDRECCRIAELAGLLRMGAAISLGQRRPEGPVYGLNYATKNAAVARRTLSLIKELNHELRPEVMASRSRQLNKLMRYGIRIRPAAAVNRLLERVGFLQEGRLNIDDDMGILRHTHCRIAYLRGAFLGGGTVNRPEASYNLELVCTTYAQGHMLHQLLRRLDFPAGFTDRHDNYIVYIKSSEDIIDFLAMLGADEAVEQFEVARNVKEVREQVNRIVNCETANLQRAATAAGRQLDDINYLATSGRLAELKDTLREAAEMRLAHPEASLKELADIMHLTKSGLNHRLDKLKTIAAAERAARTEDTTAGN